MAEVALERSDEDTDLTEAAESTLALLSGELGVPNLDLRNESPDSMPFETHKKHSIQCL